MSTMQDPPRLLELPDTPDALRSSLDLARHDGLDAASAARVAEGVTAQVGTGGAAGPTGAGGSGGLSAPGMKIVAGLVGAGLIAGGLWLAGPGQGQGSPDEPPAAAVVEEPGGEPAAVAGAVAGAVEAAPPAVPAPEPTASAAGESRVPKKVSAPVPAASKQEPKTPASSLAEEHRLLSAARAALGTDPSRALQLTREHERRFPDGVLAQEREVIAIQALAATGQNAAARDKAEGFDQQYPGSPHRRRVDEATDSKENRTPVP